MPQLGNTNIEISKLCFGSLTLSKFQSNLPPREGADLIEYAFQRGITFLDTAEIYENYEPIGLALRNIPREQIVLSTKAYCYDKDTALKSVEKALKELGTDYIDIFLIHEQESDLTLKGHYEALETLFSLKEQGIIRGVGISTHFIDCVRATRKYREIEILHPILNKRGIGIQDGTVSEMVEILKERHQDGIGIYSMKALGGGHLISESKEALTWMMSQEYVDATAIGMQSRAEIDYNLSLFYEGVENKLAREQLSQKKRRLIVDDYCIGCGNCVRRCKQNAIEVIDGQATPNEQCILCGYCATVCPQFCIKVI